MNKVVDIADFWQFKITFEKYGLLVFERIHDSELFSWNKDISDQEDHFFEKLFEKTFIADSNSISLSNILYENISESEKQLFYEKYFEKQFNSFKIKPEESIIKNFKKACNEYELKIKADMEKMSKTLKESHNQFNDILKPIVSPLRNFEESMEPFRRQQKMMSKMFNNSGLNSIQIAMESIQRKNNLLSSLMLPKSVNPFLGIADSIKFPSFENYYLNQSLKSLDCLSSNIDTFNSLRNLIPKNLFDYEVGFAKKYSNIYSSLNSSWSFLYSENDDSEPYLATKDGQFLPSANAKDLVGVERLFSDITQAEVANFLGVLEKYPFFASQDSTGKKIFEGLKEYIKTKTIVICNHDFFRARKWEKNQEITFTENTMWLPPFGRPGQGRFNFSGIPYLYLADTIEIAKKETSIGNTKKKAHTVMKITNKSDFILFDMTNLNSIVFQYCNHKNPDKNYQQYLIPNYIAQCFDYMNKYENIKIDGIKYTSIHNKKGENISNYVLFNKGQNDFKDVEIVE